MGVVSLLTLTIWYGDINWLFILHTIAQSVIGLILSLPLCKAFIFLWNKPFLFRISASIFLVIIIAFVWTLARLSLYIEMTGYNDLWEDFGGWFFSGIFIYLCWTGFFHGIKYYRLLQVEHSIMLKAAAETREEQLKRMRAQSVARDAQIKMLRYQLNPHFLCNTLNAINSLIELEEPKIAQRMTIQLSKFLRYSLDNNPDTKISLEHEINALNLYLEIEKIRFGERLELDFQIDHKAKSAQLPSLLLQPIIENSMKHVIAKNEEGGTIRLLAQVIDEQLVLELSDTGCGMLDNGNKMYSEKGRGVGLRNIDERLKVLYGTNYIYDLAIMPSGGLKTTIKIPFEIQSVTSVFGEGFNNREL
jgi:sensor histidine kinase YesM